MQTPSRYDLLASKHKPLIAIIPSPSKNAGQYVMRSSYFDAVFSNGGIPVYVPYSTDAERIHEYAAEFDGFLFSGGVDVHPKFYGEEITSDKVEVSDARDEFEFALFEEVFCGGKPVLGICRGIQFLNVALGGSLYQHIDGHSQTEPGSIRTQRVSLSGGRDGKLFSLCGGSIMTNSFHHQAIKKPAAALKITAKSDDGIIEGVELPSHPFFVGVQWHPELFFTKDPAAAALFEAFIVASSKRR